LKFTFLGTGTSQGIPVIGCTCKVCKSTDPRDKRFRTSGLLEVDGVNLVIDTGPDFRMQMLHWGPEHLDGILITHEHNDHIIGLDDIRPFYFMQQKDIPVYGLSRVLAEAKERFSYFFAENPYPGVPRIAIHPITKEDQIEMNGLSIQPIEVMHGQMPILGYRIDDLVYITDAKYISDDEAKKIAGCKILIINALHHHVHHSHFNLEEALAFVETVRPDIAWLTHMSHIMGDHDEISKQLPQNVKLAFDGLFFEF